MDNIRELVTLTLIFPDEENREEKISAFTDAFISVSIPYKYIEKLYGDTFGPKELIMTDKNGIWIGTHETVGHDRTVYIKKRTEKDVIDFYKGFKTRVNNFNEELNLYEYYTLRAMLKDTGIDLEKTRLIDLQDYLKKIREE